MDAGESVAVPAAAAAPEAWPPRDLYGWFREMRENAPVWYNPQRGMWNVFRYSDVERVATEFGLFSSEFLRLVPPEQRGEALSLISLDPPLHRKLRALVSQAFTPQAAAALEPRIRQIASELLDAVLPSGRIELIGDLAEPLPVTVIAELLGVSPADRADFKRWSDAVIQVGTENPIAAMSGQHLDHPDLLAFRSYFTEAIEQRRHAPGNDLISRLVQAQIDGQSLTEEELLAFCSLLLVAGNETTTNLLGNALLAFDEQPTIWAQLRADPVLLPNAIEEALRYHPPANTVLRVTTADVTLAGQTIPANSVVLGWLGAANHDPAQFVEPERFDITRAPNRHLSFGHGIHFCLGAPLARLEMRVALEEMLRRFHTIARVPDEPVELEHNQSISGVRRLVLRFTVG